MLAIKFAEFECAKAFCQGILFPPSFKTWRQLTSEIFDFSSVLHLKGRIFNLCDRGSWPEPRRNLQYSMDCWETSKWMKCLNSTPRQKCEFERWFDRIRFDQPFFFFHLTFMLNLCKVKPWFGKLADFNFWRKCCFLISWSVHLTHFNKDMQIFLNSTVNRTDKKG